MNADFEIERAGSVTLARRGDEDAVLANVPADQMCLGLVWDPEDSLRLSLAAYHVETLDGDEAWHINLRMPLSRAQARGLMQFLAFALSQDDAE